MEIKRQYCASVYVVDFETKKALLMYNKKLDKWLQPGGHIEDDKFELPIQCCKREALEETGYIIEVIGNDAFGEVCPLSIGRYINKVGDMIDIQYVGIQIGFKENNDNIENNITGWFSIDEMLDMKVDPEIINKVEYILTNYKKYVKRLVNNK